MADLKRFFKKTVSEDRHKQAASVSVPEGLWIKCPKCGEMVYREDVISNAYVCPKCGGYFRISAKRRIKMIADKGSFKEWFTGIDNSNPLDYPDYPQKIEDLREKTHLDEAILIGEATIGGIRTVIGAMDTRFLMASMGYVVGEKITRSFEEATKQGLPVILFCCSGGARMQEGIVSLMQMAKTSAAIKRHSQAGLLYTSVLTDPTTGGVTASFAMLGDIILAEPGSLIGFAGPRVIEQTIGQKLPEGFQRPEFLLEHGFLDGIVERGSMRDVLSLILKLHDTRKCYGEFPQETSARSFDTFGKKKKQKKQKNLTAWARVQIARSSDRPSAAEYIDAIFDDFMEFHGDRGVRDDNAIIGGIATLDGQPVTVIGIRKGHTTKENIRCNFGMPSPEGYKKALRLMKQAEKFGRAVIAFVDTPGAFCGLEAEERGQGEAIARNLLEMSDLKVPVLSVVIGEGGSGGALALAVGNEVWMMENATYTILSPEGFASILWKDSRKAPEAAEVMKVTAAHLKELGIIERIIPEEYPASEENLPEIAEYMKIRMKQFLEKQSGKSGEQIAQEREEIKATHNIGITTEVSGSWDNIYEIYKTACDRILAEVPDMTLMGGHSSHSYINGTNMYFVYYYNVVDCAPEEEINKYHDRINQIICEQVIKYGGSIVHHHGLGKARAKYAPQEYGSSYYMLKTLKQAFDPNGIMNMGTLIPLRK